MLEKRNGLYSQMIGKSNEIKENTIRSLLRESILETNNFYRVSKSWLLLLFLLYLSMYGYQIWALFQGMQLNKQTYANILWFIPRFIVSVYHENFNDHQSYHTINCIDIFMVKWCPLLSHLYLNQ